MTRFEICMKTRHLFGIYRYMVDLNKERFNGYDVATICDFLLSIVGINYECIDRQFLTDMIIKHQNRSE